MTAWWQLAFLSAVCACVCVRVHVGVCVLTFLHKIEGQLLVLLNIFMNLGTFQCNCGQSFQRKSDLTRHQNFCRATDLSLVQDEGS